MCELSPVTVTKLLLEIPVFAELESEVIEEIACSMHVKLFAEGEQVITQDEHCNFIGLIQKGGLQLSMLDRRGNALAFEVLSPRDFFGLGILFPGGTSIYQAVCCEPSICFVQKKDDFQRIVSQSPQLSDYFHQLLLRRVWEIYRLFEKKPLHKTGAVKLRYPAQNPSITKSLSFISEKFADRITLNDAANVSGMSPFHFSRTFKANTGHGFKEYLNMRRIEAAKQNLRQNSMNVSEACFAAGFNDLSYFSRVFKKKVGMRPSEYMKLCHSG